MKRGRHLHSAADRQGVLIGFVSSVRAKFGQGGAHSWRLKHVRTEDGRIPRRRSPIVLFVCAFVLASGTAAFAYTTTPGGGTGQAQAITLNSPGVGSASNPTKTSLSLRWVASSELPPGGGYLVLRSTSSGGPYSEISSGTCQQSTTEVSAATSCTDTGLTAGTTYYYEVEAAYYNLSTLWTSAPDSQFSRATSQASSSIASATSQAPSITSIDGTTFAAGSAGAFQATALGSPAPTFSNTAFRGCTPSALPSGVTFSSNGLLSGTPGADAVGTYTACINAANGVGANGTQKFTLTIAAASLVTAASLVISSAAVSGATSSTPNLGPITVRRQSSSGTPITTGGALTVNLTSSPASGATFGTTEFASAPVTSVTIPSGQSTTTFWYGLTTAGGPTITASATGYTSGPQRETITTAPTGLGIALATGSTGKPVISCGPPSASYTCNVTGVGKSGSVVFSVAFWNSGKGPVVYSATQASAIKEAGQSTGSVTIAANASGSSPSTLTASLGTSTLTFGPYTLTISVSS